MDQQPKEQKRVITLSVGMIINLLLIGLVAGVAGGMFGIGGGAIMVPAMVLLLALDQKFATGTSIGAQILPVGLLGAFVYYKEGNLDWRASIIIAIGLLIGTFFGAKIAAPISSATMKKFYGAFLFIIGARYLFWK
ncbi:sulfite exporter TauE/SafE family protein [Herpetosiphon geysericola]|nr:sulfite exporter TauE/SafE family protein [Herpetosiphon geysericola]